MNSNSTICLLNDSFPPLIDGVANAVTNYAEQITAQGGRAIVAALAHPQANDDNYSYPVIRYPSVDLRKKTGYMAGIPFSPETARRISEENIALLHSHCPIVSTLLARELRQLTDAPLVLTYHTKFDIDIANAVPGKVLQHGSICRFVSFSDLKVMFKRVSCDHIKDNFQGGTTHDYHFRDRSQDRSHVRPAQ